MVGCYVSYTADSGIRSEFAFALLNPSFAPYPTASDEWETLWREDGIESDTGEAHPQLLHFIETGRLAPNDSASSSVLIPGAGSGYEGVALASHGWNVTCVDISATAVEQANKRVDDMNLDFRDRFECECE